MIAESKWCRVGRLGCDLEERAAFGVESGNLNCYFGNDRGVREEVLDCVERKFEFVYVTDDDGHRYRGCPTRGEDSESSHGAPQFGPLLRRLRGQFECVHCDGVSNDAPVGQEWR